MASKLQQAKRQARLAKARAEVERAQRSFESAKTEVAAADRLVALERAKSELRKLTRRKRAKPGFFQTIFG
jgi:hypothetical protein